MFSERKSPLAAEVERQGAFQANIRERLYGAASPGQAPRIAVALAAVSAERTYRLLSDLPQWQNATSAQWAEYLPDVWRYVGGETEPHYVLSRALAAFLTSPLNHVEGQDGPNDFDRPHTIAAYYAVVGVVTGVSIEAAGRAVGQVFDALDLRHDAEMTPAHIRDRWWRRRRLAVTRCAVASGEEVQRRAHRQVLRFGVGPGVVQLDAVV